MSTAGTVRITFAAHRPAWPKGKQHKDRKDEGALVFVGRGRAEAGGTARGYARPASPPPGSAAVRTPDVDMSACWQVRRGPLPPSLSSHEAAPSRHDVGYARATAAALEDDAGLVAEG